MAAEIRPVAAGGKDRAATGRYVMATSPSDFIIAASDMRKSPG